MHLNVAQLLKEPCGSSRTYAIDENLAPGDGAESQRLKGLVRLLRTDRGIWVSLALDSDVPCTCSRCLDRYRQPVRIAMEEEFFPRIDPQTGTPISGLADAAASIGIDSNHNLDLTEPIKQYSTLSVPMKPVCRDDCRGICPTCGADLNEIQCRCAGEVRDGRLGALLDMADNQ